MYISTMSTFKFSFVLILLLALCINSGLTLKCITNGNLPEWSQNDCKDCEHRDRFAEKIVECGDGTCGKITGPTFGSQPLLLCAPKFDAGEKPGCKPKDGNTICRCDTALCNKAGSLKCITNGNLPDFDSSCQDCEHKDRFAEKTVDCGDGTCAKLAGPKLGPEPLYLCAPSFEDDETSGCRDIDGMEVCRCKTDFCTKESSAGKLISYWSLIVFAVVISV